jgi:hypothetical protein
MTPKEKAKYLVDKYIEEGICFIGDYSMEKSCALIVVEEVRNFHDSLFYATKGSLLDKYLDEVKKEIEKL